MLISQYFFGLIEATVTPRFCEIKQRKGPDPYSTSNITTLQLMT